MRPHETSILRLPQELLLKIFFDIDGINRSECLRNLALTHRDLRYYAYEALIRNAVIPQRSIPTYIALLSQHLSWLALIKRVELRNFSSQRQKFQKPSPELMEKSANYTRSLIVLKVEDEISSEELYTLLNAYKAWHLLLLAALPNAKELSMSPKSSRHHRNGYPDRFQPVILGGKLHLTTRSDTQMEILHGAGKHSWMGIKRADNLRVLQVDVRLLTQLDANALDFPKSIETLQVPCGYYSLPWLWVATFRQKIQRDHRLFENLKQLQLLFKTERSAVMWLVADVQARAKLIRKEWEHSRVSLEISFV